METIDYQKLLAEKQEEIEQLKAEVNEQARWIHLTKSHAPYQAAVGEFQVRAEYWADRAERAEAQNKMLKEQTAKECAELADVAADPACPFPPSAKLSVLAIKRHFNL